MIQLTRFQLRTRRYYLHRKAKKFARVAVKPKTIFVSFTNDLAAENKYVQELRDRFGYVIQLELV